MYHVHTDDSLTFDVHSVFSLPQSEWSIVFAQINADDTTSPDCVPAVAVKDAQSDLFVVGTLMTVGVHENVSQEIRQFGCEFKVPVLYEIM